MKVNCLVSSLFLACVTIASSVAYAAPPPAQNINPGHHPNLAAAQASIRQAFDQISAAQAANEWQLGGHAESAKRLLDGASAELRAAATVANNNWRYRN